MRTKEVPGSPAAWQRLRDLAGLHAGEGLAVSLYFGFDPRVTPTGVETETRLTSLLDRARRSEAAAGELSRAQQAALDADLERIRRHVAGELPGSGKSLAVFASELDGIFETVAAAGPLPDDVRVGRRLYLVPLADRAARERTALLAVVGREQGLLYTLSDSRLEKLGDLFVEQPRRHAQGGWLQSKLQRWTDNLERGHLKKVAGALDTEVRARPGVQVVLAGPKEYTAELVGLLGQEARAAIAGEIHPQAQAPQAAIVELATPLLAERARVEEAATIARWRAAAAQEGKAVFGWADTLAAASDGRVELLLHAGNGTHAAFECPACGRAAAEEGTCPLDGTTLRRCADGLDLVVRQTLVHGGAVWQVRDHFDLGPVGGIGALVSFPA